MTPEDAGRQVGSTAKSLATAAKNSKIPAKVEKAGTSAQRGWSRMTGRDGKRDAKILGISAAAIGGVVVTSSVMSAASSLVTTGVVVGAGVAGAAIYCKRNGHDEEVARFRKTSRRAGSIAQESVRTFADGMRTGVVGANAPGGPHG